MPSTRQSFSERRRVNLFVHTDISPEVDRYSPIRRPSLSTRGRSQTRKKASKSQSGTDEFVNRPLSGWQAFHNIFPHVYLALYDPTKTIKLPFGSEDSFTHVVKMQYLPPTGVKLPECKLTSDSKINVHMLAVNIHTADADAHEPLSLSSQQMLVARDFLCLALPFSTGEYRDAASGWIEPSPEDRVKILITAPIRSLHHKKENMSSMDVMALVICYLSFVSGEGYDHVLKAVRDTEDAIPEAWRTGLEMLAEASGAGDFIEEVVANV